jgi:hypothetical protein
MLKHELLRDQGVLILRPEGALRAEDFAALAGTVDPYLEQHGDLKGLMIDAPSFPGWEDFSGFLSHVRFVRDHHRRIRRIAVVSDSKLLNVAPKIASHFVAAQVQTFGTADRAAAMAWIEGGAK